MARDEFGQKDRWREEPHADDLAAGRKVTSVQGDDAISTGGKSRGEDRLIIGIGDESCHGHLTIIDEQQLIREEMDKVVDALTIDRAHHLVVDAMLHPDPDQLSDDKGAPDGFVLVETC